MDRVNELVKRSISEIIRKELSFDLGLITINDVQVAPNLRNANVFFGVIGKDPSAEPQALKLLMDHREKIQHLMSREVILKYTPVLKFVLDTSVERGVRVLQIMDELERTHPEQFEEEEEHS
ncbi:MAG: 30S ribosome-binding factor RbfA [Verrucomicrobiae bacterium]|nr:30S ribosome-binding factor RbfA [Verrucomicrobiae bacterium]